MPGVPVGRAVHVRVPASSANLGPGFDSVGLALGVWDDCVVTTTDEPGVVVEVHGEGEGAVPLGADHLVVRTLSAAWGELGFAPPAGVRLVCHNAVPHGRGMGSSATAIVTGIIAAQGLCGFTAIDRTAVCDLASRLEGHPDNASASVFGGLTVSWSDDPGAPGATHTARPPIHPQLDVVVFVPSVQLSTAKARSVLPAQVRLADAAANSARVGLLVHALTSDPSLLLPATRDWLHQEARRRSYAESMDLVDRLRAQGHAAVISGAGPSVLVLTTRQAQPQVKAGGDGWRRLAPGIPDHGATLQPVGRTPAGHRTDKPSRHD